MLDRLLLLGELPGHFTVGGKHKEGKACILASAFPTRFLCGYLLGHSCIIPQPLLNHFVLRNTFSPLCSCRFPERFGSVQKRQAARGRVLPALQGGLTPRGHSAARLAALKNTRRYFVRCSYPCKNLRLWADAGEERCPAEQRWVLLGVAEGRALAFVGTFWLQLPVALCLAVPVVFGCCGSLRFQKRGRCTNFKKREVCGATRVIFYLVSSLCKQPERGARR